MVPASPAAQAGVQEGDILEAVDDRDVSGVSSQQLLDLLRGAEGQPVKLRLRRGGEGGSVVEITVVRGRYRDAPLTMRVLPEGVCVFRLSSFPISFVLESLAFMATSTISANRLGANGIATILVRYDVGSAQTISGSARWQVRSGSPRALRCVAVHLSPCGSRVKKPNAESVSASSTAKLPS